MTIPPSEDALALLWRRLTEGNILVDDSARDAYYDLQRKGGHTCSERGTQRLLSDSPLRSEPVKLRLYVPLCFASD